MLSFDTDYILEALSPSFLLGAAGMTTISVLSGLHLIWAKFTIDRNRCSRERKSCMKAVVITSYNGISSVKVESDLPIPKHVLDNEVLIRVMAVGIDAADLMITWGHGRCIRDRLLKSLPNYKSDGIILGRECSGIVLDTGKSVTSVKKGDNVWAVAAYCLQGLMAEYAVVKEEYVARKPKNLTFEEAASLPYTAIQAWNIIGNEARLSPGSVKGKRILIHAGNSPVGAFMIQIMNSWGASVTTTIPTSGLPMCRQLGVDDAIVYSVADFERELCRRKRFDVVINTMGTILHQLCLDVVSPGGKVVTLVSTPTLSDKFGVFLGSLIALALQMIPCIKKIQQGISCFSWDTLSYDKDLLTQTTKLVEEGKIRPIIQRVYEMHDVKSGFRHLGHHNNVGKAVLQISSFNK